MPGQRLAVGARVACGERGAGVLAVDNEDGTWNVDLDDGGEADMPAKELQPLNELQDWSLPACGPAGAPGEEAAAPRLWPDGLRSRHGGAKDTAGAAFAASWPTTGARGGLFPAELDARTRGGGAEDSGDEAPGTKELDAELARGERTASARRSRLSFFFLILTVGPGLCTFLLLVQEWFQPLVTLVPPREPAQVEGILSGGKPWLIACVTKRSAKAKAPKVLERAAEILRPKGMRVARLPCWESLELSSGRQTLARRYGFRDRPPVVMASRGSGDPVLLASRGLSAEQLASRAWAAVAAAGEGPASGGAQRAGATSRPRGKGGSTRDPGLGGQRDYVGERPKAWEEDGEAEEPPASTENSQEQEQEEEEEEEEVNLDA